MMKLIAESNCVVLGANYYGLRIIQIEPNPEIILTSKEVLSKGQTDIICEAINNYEALKENLARIIDRIEECDLQGNFPSAYERAKKALNS